MSADTDVLAGVAQRWAASDLRNTVPGKLWTGRLPANPLVPYATATSERAQEPQYFTLTGDGDTYIDFRLVTFRVWVEGAENAGQLALQIKGVFDRQRFEIPNAYLVSCLSKGEPRTEEDAATKQGHDVWIGIVEVVLATSRAVGT